jgi:hypothetical protein
MKGRMFGWILLIGLMLIPVLLCCGVAFADDGTMGGGSDWLPVWLAITAIGATLVNLYIDVLKPMLVAVWSEKEDTFRWKLRGSLLAIFGYAVWDTLKAAYKKGLLDGVIGVHIGIIKRKFGVPVAIKRVGAVFNK